MQEHFLQRVLVNVIEQCSYVLVVSDGLDVLEWEVSHCHDYQIPYDPLELCIFEPTVTFVVQHKLHKLLEDGEGGRCVVRREDYLSECKQCAETDVLDERTVEAAVETDGVHSDEDVFVGVPQQLRIDQTESGLDDPQRRLHLPELIF